MKRIAILLLIATACSSASAKIIVRGKIIGYDGKSKVTYIPTIEGIFAPYGHDIKPEQDGTFRIEYDNRGYGNLKVYYKTMSFRFFHDADSKIYFEIREPVASNPKRKIAQDEMFNVFDSLKRANLVRITGDYAAINRFYNQNLRSTYFTTNMIHGHYYSTMIFNAPTPSIALRKLDSLTQIETRQVDQLIDVETSKPEIHNFLKNEIYAFYAAVFLNGLYLKRVEQIEAMQDSTQHPNIYNREWEIQVESMKKQLTDLSPAPNSPDYVDFVESMMNNLEDYKKYEFPKPDKSTLDNWVRRRLLDYDTTLVSDPTTRFEYELFGINMFIDNQMMYSPALLNAINVIQEKHPGSEHLKHYQPKIDALKAYLAKSTDSNIITENYTAFNELVKRFEGKNVFIDIWATWCRPCIEEFRHRTVVQAYADRHDIEILYISIDKPAWEDRWKRSISANDLQGIHFRADRDFINDMWQTIGGQKGAIPRYVLIDKQGKIFDADAPPPSSAPELSKQLKTLVAPH